MPSRLTASIRHTANAGKGSDMKVRIKWLVLTGCALLPLAASALSLEIGRDIWFPQGFDSHRAAAIRAVIQDERFHFVGGVVSCWPPDNGTRLSFAGDAASLNRFFKELRQLHGVGLRLILYRGRNDDLRRDSAWQLDFSQAKTNQLAVYLNLNAPNLDFAKINFPAWPAP